MGDDEPEERSSSPKKLVSNAVSNGISAEGASQLRTIISEFAYVLRIRLGPGPPENVELMKIELIENARPVQTRTRRYAPNKREFLEKYTSKAYGVSRTAPGYLTKMITFNCAFSFLRTVELLGTVARKLPQKPYVNNSSGKIWMQTPERLCQNVPFA
eukprot:Plantae.Rhodophyta-Palmaria_palmata.ctg21423.p1 GENE.Plantae.Rhodophyta-Palmaria_palmata.ctg21423~~Plantae.Rhodophyta-Palmaria_palmata.ctg21423.p1  ORF type:complete len:166 (-),score=14.74 Plantae.Rhodophyta-Palmaria_palmata.ctg21423:25-498(-)